MPLDAITPERVETYLEGRREQEAAVATVNRELAGLKHIFSWGVKHGHLDKNPMQHIQQEKEDNVRDQILDPGQFDALQAHSPVYLRPISLVAYQTGMRRGEILGLTWDKVDLKAGFIRLKADDTKTRESRIIPLSPELVALFKELQKTRALRVPQVFLRDGQPMLSMKGAFRQACKAAGIKDFVFHDLRHTAITNMRRAGVDPLTIMQISGHKTMVCFTRYNSFRESDLRAAVEKSNTYLTLAHSKAVEQVNEEASKTAASA
jgi:integrase